MSMGIPGLEAFEPIGRGGFASVYRAYQPKFDRHVAVKVLRVGELGEDERRRFEREQRAMGSLSSHPAIVTVFDSGFTDEGSPYLVMELMEGGSLQDRIASGGPLEWPEAVEIVRRIGGAVAQAHGAGIVHRDIKPDNILLSSFGEAKLADFGIATLGSMTATSSVSATIEYAPPEVLDGAQADELADVYALAATLFTMVAGRSAFRTGDADTAVGVLSRVLSAPVPDLRPEGVPGPLCDVIEAGMAKAREDRPPSASRFVELLGEAAAVSGDEPGATRVLGRPDRDRPAAGATRVLAAGTPGGGRRRRRLWGLGAAALVVAAAAAGAVLLFGGSGDPPTTTAAMTTVAETTVPTTAAPTTTPVPSTATATTSTSEAATTTRPAAAETTVPEPAPAPELASWLVVANRRGPDLLCGGSGGPACARIDPLDTSATDAVAVADVNGDDRPDLIFGNGRPDAGDGRRDTGIPPVPDTVCLDDGAGGWACSPIDGDAFDTVEVVTADLNGDGHADLVTGNQPERSGLHPERARVCLGDGTGGFACSSLFEEAAEESQGGAIPESITPVDLNGDEAVDLVLAENGWRNTICLGDGAGGFSCRELEDGRDSHLVHAHAVADFDGDGTADVFFAFESGTHLLCRGDGLGEFSCSDVPNSLQDVMQAAAGDLNRDGHPDLVLATGSAGGSEVDACFGDGAGAFFCSYVTDKPADSGAVLADDLDGDGSIDILVAGPPSQLCLGDGSGGFSCSGLELADEAGLPVEAGDVIVLPAAGGRFPL